MDVSELLTVSNEQGLKCQNEDVPTANVGLKTILVATRILLLDFEVFVGAVSVP